MALLLNVPYAEKDEAKKMGAWWNPEIKRWYVKNKAEYPKFRKWISENSEFNIICDYLYIIEGVHTCFQCGKKTRVIGYGIENYYEFADTEDIESGFIYERGEIHIASHISPIPKQLLDYIQQKYNYKMKYSKTIKDSYLANCCDNCNILQGDFFLFQEVDSPFWIEDEKAASKLSLYKIPLKYDLVLNTIEMGWGSNDYLIKKYGKIIPLDLKME